MGFCTTSTLNCVLSIAFKCALHETGTELLCTVNRLCKSTPWIKQKVKSFPPHHSYRLFWWSHCITLNWLVSQNCFVFPDNWIRLCVRVLRGRREERQGALLFMFIAHRHMIAIVQGLTENGLCAVLYTSTKGEKSTPCGGSWQSYFFSQILMS